MDTRKRYVMWHFFVHAHHPFHRFYIRYHVCVCVCVCVLVSVYAILREEDQIFETWHDWKRKFFKCDTDVGYVEGNKTCMIGIKWNQAGFLFISETASRLPGHTCMYCTWTRRPLFFCARVHRLKISSSLCEHAFLCFHFLPTDVIRNLQHDWSWYNFIRGLRLWWHRL